MLTETLAAAEFAQFAVIADLLVILASAAVVAIAMQRTRLRESTKSPCANARRVVTFCKSTCCGYKDGNSNALYSNRATSPEEEFPWTGLFPNCGSPTSRG